MKVVGRGMWPSWGPSGNRQARLFSAQRRIGTMGRGFSGRNNRSQLSVYKLLSAKCSSEASFPSKSVRRASHKDNVKSFIISLLLLVSFLTLGALMLMHRPQKVDAFLNSDEPVESKHVVTSGMIR